MNKTRIAVAGTGHLGQAHIQAIRHSVTCTLSALVDPDVAAREYASRAGVSLHASLADLLQADRPDAVVLATPAAVHFEQAMQCLEVDLPVLIERPLAASVQEAEDLVRLVESSRARVLVGHHRSHSPIIMRAREVIEAGWLGQLVAVQGSALWTKPPEYFSSAPWRARPGGGPILLNLIHEVHSLRMLCGEILAVQATATNATRQFPVEDTVAITFTFANGALGTFLLSDTAASARSWEHTAQENPAFPHYPDEDCYVISGTRGTLAIPSMRMKVYESETGRSWWEPFAEQLAAVVREDAMALQMEHFGAVVRGEQPPLVTARDGLMNLRVTDAVIAATHSGERVYVDFDL